VENMSAKISTLLRDENLRKKMGSKARELVIENYTIGEMSRKILNIYNELNTRRRDQMGAPSVNLKQIILKITRDIDKNALRHSALFYVPSLATTLVSFLLFSAFKGF